jgi:hypothetical protein
VNEYKKTKEAVYLQKSAIKITPKYQKVGMNNTFNKFLNNYIGK